MTTEAQIGIRNILFGDLPFSQLPVASAEDSHAEPWLSFAQAREQLEAGDPDWAKQTLRKILEMPDLESRHYLQAWHFLRGLGELPGADQAKHLYGVVVEVTLPDG